MNEQAMELLRVFELEEEADTLASNLPYGKQRKLEIARATGDRAEASASGRTGSRHEPERDRGTDGYDPIRAGSFQYDCSADRA